MTTNSSSLRKAACVVRAVVLFAALLLCSPAARAATFTVQFGFGGNVFNPRNLTIDVGDTVNWVGNPGHTVTGTGAEPLCGNANVTSCSQTFRTPGTFTYQCNPHVGQGMTGSITVRQGNQPPTIQISAAGSLSVTRGGNVSVNVTASDPEGSISKVELFAGETLLGTRTIAPYNVTASTGPLTPGSYEVTAVVTDGQGLTATSSPLSLTVQAAPAIRITSVRRSGLDILLSWTGGVGPFAVQYKQALTDVNWGDLSGSSISGNQTTIVQGATLGILYFRLRDAGQQ